jgi:hypothetical protein
MVAAGGRVKGSEGCYVRIWNGEDGREGVGLGYRWKSRRRRTKEGLKSPSGPTIARILIDREMNLRGFEEARAGDAPLD